jgi:hypothetical protein
MRRRKKKEGGSAMQTEYLVNLVFCVVIVALALVDYRRVKAIDILLVGLGFALFGVSHLVRLLEGPGDYKVVDIGWLNNLLIAVRICGYSSVVLALVLRVRRPVD